jgi:hypothetical protein
MAVAAAVWSARKAASLARNDGSSGASIATSIKEPYTAVLSALVRLERLGKIREAGVGRWVFVAVRR